MKAYQKTPGFFGTEIHKKGTAVRFPDYQLWSNIAVDYIEAGTGLQTKVIQKIRIMFLILINGSMQISRSRSMFPTLLSTTNGDKEEKTEFSTLPVRKVRSRVYQHRGLVPNVPVLRCRRVWKCQQQIFQPDECGYQLFQCLRKRDHYQLRWTNLNWTSYSAICRFHRKMNVATEDKIYIPQYEWEVCRKLPTPLLSVSLCWQ